MKTNTIILAGCYIAVLALMTTQSNAAILIDDFNSYLIGDTANEANANYVPVGINAIGVIAAGTATANVASSNVLSQVGTTGKTATRMTGIQETGNVTVQFDARPVEGTHNFFVLQVAGGLTAALVTFQENGGDPTKFNFRTKGSTPTVTQGTFDSGDWYRVTMDFNINSGDGSLSTVAFSLFNLTDGVEAVALTAPINTWQAATSISRLQVESVNASAGHSLQVDNLSAPIPEPASLALLGLGCVAMLMRNRDSK